MLRPANADGGPACGCVVACWSAGIDDAETGGFDAGIDDVLLAFIKEANEDMVASTV